MNERLLRPADIRSHRRLAWATAAAAVIIGSAIVLLPVSLRFLHQVDHAEPLELQLVSIVEDESRVELVVDEPGPETPSATLTEELPSESQSEGDIELLMPELHDKSVPTVDWHAILQDVVKSDSLFATPTMHPEFDEQRRVARIRFRKSAAPVKKEIWDNVEKDQMGRSILRAGDCYRVLDDPSAANQWLQDNFTQYMFFCSTGKTIPKELPFVADIRERYVHLQQDDATEKFQWQ